MARMTRDEWITAFAAATGVSAPSLQEIRDLLELAGTAAHSSERTAAPLACWIAGRSELDLDRLREIAATINPPDAPRAADPAAG